MVRLHHFLASGLHFAGRVLDALQAVRVRVAGGEAHASTEVHCGQRLAPAGMVLRHSGHSLVAGGGGGAGFGMKRFTCLMTRKITKATITNSMTVLIKRP